MKLREVKVRMNGFSHVFGLAGGFYFVTGKGILAWDGMEGDNAAVKPQIVINQVEMMQFPI